MERYNFVIMLLIEKFQSQNEEGKNRYTSKILEIFL